MKISTRSIVITFIAIIILGALAAQYYLKMRQNAQAPAKMFRIGFLLTDKDVQSDNIRGFKDGMRALGYAEGENIAYIEKNAGGDDKLKSQYGEELNAKGLDLIIVGASSAAAALKKLPDLKTPVYFLAAGRPRDLVKNLQAPEGFFTGIGEGTVEFSGKRLELLKEAAPSVKRVISIIEKNHGNTPLFKEKSGEAAKNLGIKMVYIVIEKPDDLPKVISQVRKQNGDAYLASPMQSNQKYAKELAAQFIKAKLPSINDELSLGASIGFLMTYSDDRYKTGVYAASRVDKILNGTPLSQIPVEFAKDVILEINQKTAKAIGVKIPDEMLLRAYKVYSD